jgi:hypothetical protein
MVVAVLGMAAADAQVTGRVVDARGGEPLARVRVRLLGGQQESLTDAQGRFSIAEVAPGDYVLHVETVGYRLVTERFTLSEGDSRDFEIALSPETFERRDSVQVAADILDIAGVSTPSETTLDGAELKNLSTVLMDDPMRAVHALPGVSANNDYQARFAVRGAGFDRIAFYLDDTLLHAPFHSIGSNEGDASMSVLNGDMVEDVLLLPTSAPARYGDSSAAVLQVRLCEGSRDKRSLRISAGVAGSSILAESPFAGGRGSWIASARKSYLRYLTDRLSSDTALGIGLADVQGNLVYALSERHSVSLYAMNGTTDLDREAARDRSGVNALITGATRSTLARSSWRYTRSRLVLTATGSFLRDRYDTSNRYDRPLAGGFYGEWAATARLDWEYSANAGLEAGFAVRRQRDDGFGFRYLTNVSTVTQLDSHRGVAVRQGEYVEQSWRSRGGRVRASAGIRRDAHQFYSVAVWLPRASLAVRPGGAWDLRLGWGQYAQYPELAALTSPWGGRRLGPERANAVEAGLERRLGDNARVRLSLWNRSDRDLLAAPFLDARLAGTQVVRPAGSNLYNSIRGYSRGIELMVQRRTANRLSGWLSYTLSYGRERDDLERQHYWSNHDQRHVVNAYASYRLTSSVNLSGRWSFGSGEPIPGFYRMADGLYYVTGQRNELRMSAYQRADVRANKSFTWNRSKLTLYGEVVNLTNRHNLRFLSFDSVNTTTGRVQLTIERAFPIVPLAGITLEF